MLEAGDPLDVERAVAFEAAAQAFGKVCELHESFQLSVLSFQ